MSEDRGPVFVVGSHRSGTSIFAWCLGQHPNIVNLPETNWLARLGVHAEELYRLGTVNGQYSHLSQMGMTKEEFYAQLGRSIDGMIQSTNAKLVGAGVARTGGEFRRRRSADDPKRRWVDATPGNSDFIYPLSRLFPSARFIHLVRNPHEVARSLSRFSRAGGRDYSLREAYDTWVRMTKASWLAETALGRDRMIRVRYEQLVADPKGVFQTVLAFLEEPFSEDCERPLVSKINSSSVDDEPLPRRSKAGAVAGRCYRQLLEAAEPLPDGSAAKYSQMEADFLRYWRSQQPCRFEAPPSGILSKAGAWFKSNFSKRGAGVSRA